MPFGEEFGLTEHEFDFVLGDASGALLDIDELFGGHRKENDLAAEMSGGPGLAQPHRRTEPSGDLRIVPAAVRTSGDRIGERVLRGPQAVELADQGEPPPP